ncbi:hypothetical protein ABBQ32_14152 [Trebouxia sp. C0010 RCD-2024]
MAASPLALSPSGSRLWIESRGSCMTKHEKAESRAWCHTTFQGRKKHHQMLASRLIAVLEEQMEGQVPDEDHLTNPLGSARQKHLEAGQAKPRVALYLLIILRLRHAITHIEFSNMASVTG